jgi:hypothetical protein
MRSREGDSTGRQRHYSWFAFHHLIVEPFDEDFALHFYHGSAKDAISTSVAPLSE